MIPDAHKKVYNLINISHFGTGTNPLNCFRAKDKFVR